MPRPREQKAPQGSGAWAAKKAGHRDNAQMLKSQFTAKGPNKASEAVRVLAAVFGSKGRRR